MFVSLIKMNYYHRSGKDISECSFTCSSSAVQHITAEREVTLDDDRQQKVKAVILVEWLC